MTTTKSAVCVIIIKTIIILIFFSNVFVIHQSVNDHNQKFGSLDVVCVCKHYRSPHSVDRLYCFSVYQSSLSASQQTESPVCAKLTVVSFPHTSRLNCITCSHRTNREKETRIYSCKNFLRTNSRFLKRNWVELFWWRGGTIACDQVLFHHSAFFCRICTWPWKWCH